LKVKKAGKYSRIDQESTRKLLTWGNWLSIQKARSDVRMLLGSNDVVSHQTHVNRYVGPCFDFGITLTWDKVHYIADPELAYVMQRYRECHDFYHCICSLPVNVESELALKYFEFVNLGLPMAALSAAFGHLRLDSKKRSRLFSEYVPWAMKCGGSARSLITVYWEERWGQDVEEMKKELGIWDPPEARWSKPLSEAKAAAADVQSVPS